MIFSYLNQGSGAGNQLFRMLAARVRAYDLGVDWAMVWNPDNSGKPIGFKCKDFIQFDESKIIYELPKEVNYWKEKKIVDENGVDIRGYDPEFNFIEDNTIIDGEFQDERYWEHREKEIGEWLKVELLEMPDDVCVIGFRGGEFAMFPDLFLTSEYWDLAIVKMRKINPNIKNYEIHTDDIETAKKILFPLFYNSGYKVKYIHDIGINWRSMRYAKHAIIANSSFYILPRLLNGGITIAPRFWARRNTKVWALPQNFYKSFLYI